ncbi:hypothetical protein H5410_018729, partial [Solanum commersonii]
MQAVLIGMWADAAKVMLPLLIFQLLLVEVMPDMTLT